MDSDCSSEDSTMTPRTRKLMDRLLKAIESGEARLVDDGQGRTRIEYSSEKTNLLQCVSTYKAHTIQEGKTLDDVHTKVHVWLEMVKAIKANRAPACLVVLDSSKAKVSSTGVYQEGFEFEFLKEVLGTGNMAGDILVVKDKRTGAVHAVKMVMISEFLEDEVWAWIDLGESDTFPSLYMIRLVDNKIVYHMEKIEHGVTLEKIINEHRNNMCEKDPDLVRQFSLCMFHGLLSALKEMHDKNWVHDDLHGGNVMLTKDAMKLKILDFGMTHKRKDGEKFDHIALKDDILNAVRHFSGMYSGQDFGGNFELEKEIKDGTLKKFLEETTGLKEKDREELVQLIMMTYQVTLNPEQAGYGDTSPIMLHIGEIQGNMTEVLKRAAAVLFPDFYRGAEVKDLHAMRGQDVSDGAGGAREEGDFDVDAAAAANLRLSIIDDSDRPT